MRRLQANIPAIQTYRQRQQDAKDGVKREYDTKHLKPTQTWLCPCCEAAHPNVPASDLYSCNICGWAGSRITLLLSLPSTFTEFFTNESG